MSTLTDEELFGAAEATEDDLTDLLDGRPSYFAIDSEGAAAWAVDKLVSFDEREARIKAAYQELIGQVKKDRERFERRFLGELETWFDGQPKKGKSLKLLTGTLAKRTVPGGLTVKDSVAALEWARTNFPGAVIQVPTLERETLLDHIRETGEAVPGVETRPERESFSVRSPK